VKDKEEEEQLMQKLDQDFASLAQTDALLTLSSKVNPLKSVLNKKDPIPSQKGPAGSKFDESFDKASTMVNSLFYYY
jgi:hypothetical protein